MALAMAWRMATHTQTGNNQYAHSIDYTNINAHTVDLRGVTTAARAHANVDVGELLLAHQQHGLVDLGAQDLRLQQVQRLTVDLDQTLAALADGDGGGGFLNYYNQVSTDFRKKLIAGARSGLKKSPRSAAHPPAWRAYLSPVALNDLHVDDFWMDG